ncbi:hypothetical protein HZY86_01180 [Aerococcaceae bacterium DSM 111020]|nr:hypothetical protein [Aerococcaceae bacterium DSM 111020]
MDEEKWRKRAEENEKIFVNILGFVLIAMILYVGLFRWMIEIGLFG